MTTGFCYVSQINIKQQLKNSFSFKWHVYGLIHTFDDRQAVALSLISVISSEFMYTTSRCGICNILQSRQIVIKAYIRKQFNFLNISRKCLQWKTNKLVSNIEPILKITVNYFQEHHIWWLIILRSIFI